MLLLHQAGSVKIGEVVRYTVTYTPANDRILPSPPCLYLKIKNTSAIALRAAFVHGPYTLYVSSAPKNFHHNEKFHTARRDGIPEFEPNLKAGGTWQSQLSVPESIRETAGTGRKSTDRSNADPEAASVSWVIEIASQVIFSNSAAVHYELLLGRDEKSLNLGFGGLSTGPSGVGVPGQVSDFQQSQGAKDGHHKAQQKGVFSRAVTLKVEDTASLWNKPRLPERDHGSHEAAQVKAAGISEQEGPNNNRSVPNTGNVKAAPSDAERKRRKKQKKVHLVVLTHGLHSNLSGDLLFMKESIDEAAAKAKEDAKIRRAKRREEKQQQESKSADHLRARERTDKAFGTNRESAQEDNPASKTEHGEDEDTDDEELVVRGFNGNVVRTEKGIKYLGKRLAKYVLSVTYPDQPFKPIRRTTSESISNALKGESSKAGDTEYGPSVHSKSTIHLKPQKDHDLPYRITSISFIAHSLGGLIQIYAVAYIQKHSPNFFNIIKPINFIAMASPFLGLSNENPIYVKFALDFGLVGRTGQDLGLTWRAPTIARSGWSSLVSGIGEGAHKRIEGEQDPGSKPLLRILPTGPAHTALRKFRNRTVYSNVVNDGIVPLRTSCLLFLDWQGLGRVEKARRENGLVGTMVGWGWGELTGANSSDGHRQTLLHIDGMDSDSMDDSEAVNTPTRQGHGDEVPLPALDETKDDNRSLKATRTRRPTSANSADLGVEDGVLPDQPKPSKSGTTSSGGALDSILGLFRPTPSPTPPAHIPKISKIYRRSQTIKVGQDFDSNAKSPPKSRAKATMGDDGEGDPENLSAPPKTTFFEAAGDLLNPPIPTVEFLIDPSSRPRTIFHDRIYHPDDIPPPPLKRRSRSESLVRRFSSPPQTPTTPTDHDSTFSGNSFTSASTEIVDASAMKVEEKIARAYHRDMSWRKVLVRLEPDAHNNMIVRRKFANSYGWPVIKHLVDTHFSDSAVARMRDEDEEGKERAKSSEMKPSDTGDETKRSPEDDERSSLSAGRSTHDHDHRSSVSATDHIPHLTKSDRTNSEIREAVDEVPPLNSAPLNSLHPGSLAKALQQSQKPSGPHRQDSAQWSDGDFMDSEGDSDAEHKPASSSHHHRKTSSGGGWNWTEAIAGKGAVKVEKLGGAAKDYRQQQEDAKSSILGGVGMIGGVDTMAVAATVDGGLGLSRSFSREGDGSGAVAERVARLSVGEAENAA